MKLDFFPQVYAGSFAGYNPATKFPLGQGSSGAPGAGLNQDNNLSIIGQIFGNLIPILLVIGGLILFVMIIQGGFTMLTNPSDPQQQEGGKQRITYAIIGFVILFASYWIMQILQIIFGIQVV